MRRLLTSLLVLFSCLLLGSCGIPTSSTPNRFVAPEVETRTTLPPDCSKLARAETIHIYLVRGIAGRLVPVQRCIATPATAQAVLNELDSGPQATEYRNDLESEINLDSHLTVVGRLKACHPHKLTCKLVVVRLDRYFSQLQGEAPIEELGQIVWSLTEARLGIDEVRFLAPDGKPLPVEIASGSFVNRPVSPADYNNL